ncbi:MAG: hypothetical protein IT430_07250 [Phycisphaerales bacterium]|nr:hypothetical protein [Phycisphaerales bacterium]
MLHLMRRSGCAASGAVFAAFLAVTAVGLPARVALALPPLPDDFVNDETMVLVVVDLVQATPAAIDATGRGIIENIPELGEQIAKLRTDYEPLVRAGGRLIVIAGAEPENDDLFAFMPVAGIHVDADSCDEAALTELLKKHANEFTSEPVIERQGDWMLLWQSHRLKLTNPPKDGPDLELPGFDPERCNRVRAAYESMNGRAMAIAFIPTLRDRDEAREQWDALPDEIHESPAGAAMLLRMAVQMHGWIDLGHNPSVTGVIELPEASMAAKLKAIIDSLPGLFMMQLESLEDEEAIQLEQEMEPEMALTFRVLRSLSCVHQGSKVTLSIGQADLRPILDLAGPILVKQREQAKQYQAMSQSRQIGMSLHLYANDHNNQWPNSLDDLVTAKMMTREQLDEMLTHPVTGEKNAFQYVKPDKPLDQLEEPALVAVLYELKNGQINRAGITCYADGHVEVGEQ